TIGALAHGGLRRRDGDGPAGRDRLRELLHGGHELLWLVDAVHEPDAESLRGVDHLAGVDELAGVTDAHAARQPLGAAKPRDEPERDLGEAELRLRGRVDEVARERELAAS